MDYLWLQQVRTTEKLIMSPAATRIATQHIGNIKNQCNGAVAGNRGACHSRRALEHFAEWFNHHLFLSNQLINNKTNVTCTNSNDNHVGFSLFFINQAVSNQPLF